MPIPAIKRSNLSRNRRISTC